ncbi:MAG: hypothetical protein MJZ11_01095 [Lachnospiraceae bacterium]|nr:hypothetical protein [Lachnospiraceae bacterium]
MNEIILIYILLFMTGSMSGWVLELLFRRFISTNNPERKWINPGFLLGPCLPLYGFGLMALYTMSMIPYLGSNNPTTGQIIICIFVMGVMMTLIELIAGLIFVQGMHIKLWDYKDEWMNYKGIICPKFSIIWTVLGALYYFFIQPEVVELVEWFDRNITFSFFVGAFSGIFVVDLTYSLNLVNQVKNFAKKHEIVVRYDELRFSAKTVIGETKENILGKLIVTKEKVEDKLIETKEKVGDKIVSAKDIVEDKLVETKDKVIKNK